MSARTERTRAALVEAAAAQFNSVGYFGTDTNAIARAAGLGAGSFYNHFEDKLSIFLDIYRLYVTEVLALVHSQPAGWLGRKATRVEFLRALVAHHRRWQRFRASLVALAATEPAVRTVKHQQRQRQVAAVIEHVGSRARNLEEFRGDVASLIVKLEAICDGLASGELDKLGAHEARVLGALADDLGAVLAPAASG